MRISAMLSNFGFLVIFIVIISLSCSFTNSSIKSNLGEPQSDTTITVIVNNTTNNRIRLSYISRFSEEEIIYDGSGKDTLRIEKIPFIPLKIKYKQYSVMHPLMALDTLKIEINQSQNISFHRLSKESKKYDTAYIKYCNYKLSNEYEKLREINTDLFPSLSQNQPAVVKIVPGKDSKKYLALKNQTLKINKGEWEILDSLYRLGHISESYKYVYGALINANYVNNIILCYKGTKDDNLLKLISKANAKIFDVDYLKYDTGPYKEMINNYMVSIIEKDKYVKYGKNGITINYRDVFNKAKDFFPNPFMDFVKFLCLKNIKEQSTIQDFKNYYEEYVEENLDTSYVNYFKDRFFAKDNLVDMLYDAKSDSFELSDVLQNKLKGNILYVDLWASWCVPCRELIPTSFALQSKYVNKKIKFVYISIDENIFSWRTACKVDSLASYPLSFILANSKQASFLKIINLTTIPRYILIDQNGNIINKNAPPPDSEELVKIIDSLLFPH